MNNVLVGLHELCGIYKGIKLKPFREDEKLEEGSIVTSTFILQWVGLRLSLESVLYEWLANLDVPLESYKPNILWCTSFQ